MTHFDPINKSKVSVENLKHEISKYEPKYFTQSYQKIDPDEIETKLMIKSQELEKSATTNRKNVFNTNLLNGMDKIKNYIERNNLSIENFLFGIFCGKNPKNENLLINQETWKNNFVDNDKTKEIIIPNLKNEELDAIFRAMVSNIDEEEVQLGKIISFFNDYLHKNDSIININDQSSLNEYIKNELKILFDNFDINKNDMISFDNFYKCLKSLDHKATKIDAQNIIAQYTKKNPSNIAASNYIVLMLIGPFKSILIVYKLCKYHTVS
jgi:Ca2+-binding EF-hand superfamily protein